MGHRIRIDNLAADIAERRRSDGRLTMATPIRFDGGTAVITGAASGIGSDLARHAASLGMPLALADLDQCRAAKLNADALAVATDVGNPAALEVLAEQKWQRF